MVVIVVIMVVVIAVVVVVVVVVIAVVVVIVVVMVVVLEMVVVGVVAAFFGFGNSNCGCCICGPVVVLQEKNCLHFIVKTLFVSFALAHVNDSWAQPGHLKRQLSLHTCNSNTIVVTMHS